MTPNQIAGIGRAVSELLAEAHTGGCEPSAHALEVRRHFSYDRPTWLVEAYTLDEDGATVLSAVVAPSGETQRLDAWRTDDGSTADPLARPGVRIDADGNPLYSAAWLNEARS